MNGFEPTPALKPNRGNDSGWVGKQKRLPLGTHGIRPAKPYMQEGQPKNDAHLRVWPEI